MSGVQHRQHYGSAGTSAIIRRSTLRRHLGSMNSSTPIFAFSDLLDFDGLWNCLAAQSSRFFSVRRKEHLQLC
jgi:hypothetical protein